MWRPCQCQKSKAVLQEISKGMNPSTLMITSNIVSLS